ncbi:putative TIR domain-containing protein [Rosa chinensis]|uniref:Putative TIR domain-containing protein n=1 Tax=Rosa chinensis TaxID=74649 RepID=A0A2P6SE10_ROSCH|nr:putative TIR domain-containing protein [Rosa chinensis]
MASMVIQTSSTSTPPPPPLNHPIKYDVFLSFRGADTRTKFTDHLYNALHVQEGIPTFRDSEELEKGEDLSQLFEAIEKSKIAVVILSSNYASSTWCLREVAKIAECRNKTGLIALPVFYEIEPTQVRSQTGSFKKYFDEHEQKYKDSTEKVDIWRKALTEIGGLSGWDLKEFAGVQRGWCAGYPEGG